MYTILGFPLKKRNKVGLLDTFQVKEGIEVLVEENLKNKRDSMINPY